MKIINIIAVDISENTGIYEKYSELISAKRRERISRIKSERDKIISFFTEIEIRKEISERTGRNFREIEFNYNSHGKPFLKDIPYYFSVSHSGNLIAFVFSEELVGIDIECAKKSRLKVAERFFTSNEYNYILNSKNPEHEFYRIWTAKESYIKMLGTGLSKSLKSFDVLSPELKLFFYTKQIGDYMLTVCHENALNTEYAINVESSGDLIKFIYTQNSFKNKF